MQYWVKVIDGQIDWSTLDSTAHVGEEGWFLVPQESKELIKLSEDGSILEIDFDKKKRLENKKAKDDFSNFKQFEFNRFVVEKLDGKTDVRVLSEMLYHMFNYVSGLQQSLGLSNNNLLPETLVSKEKLESASENIFMAIEQKRAEKDQQIADFIPPNVDVDPLY